jgi:hypothetical protein
MLHKDDTYLPLKNPGSTLKSQKSNKKWSWRNIFASCHGPMKIILNQEILMMRILKITMQQKAKLYWRTECRRAIDSKTVSKRKHATGRIIYEFWKITNVGNQKRTYRVVQNGCNRIILTQQSPEWSIEMDIEAANQMMSSWLVEPHPYENSTLT